MLISVLFVLFLVPLASFSADTSFSPPSTSSVAASSADATLASRLAAMRTLEKQRSERAAFPEGAEAVDWKHWVMQGVKVKTAIPRFLNDFYKKNDPVVLLNENSLFEAHEELFDLWKREYTPEQLEWLAHEVVMKIPALIDYNEQKLLSLVFLPRALLEIFSKSRNDGVRAREHIGRNNGVRAREHIDRHINEVRVLLEGGASPGMCMVLDSFDMNNPNELALITLLLDYGAQPQLLMPHVFQPEACSFLYRALEANNCAVIKLLIDRGLDLSLPVKVRRDCEPLYALDVAADCGTIETISLLLSGYKDEHLLFMLSVALKRHNTAVLTNLIERLLLWLNREPKHYDDFETAFKKICAQELFKVTATAGEDMLIMKLLQCCRTPEKLPGSRVYWAIQNNYNACALFLIQNGWFDTIDNIVDPHAHFCSPLMFAIINEKQDLISALLKAGAAITKKDCSVVRNLETLESVLPYANQQTKDSIFERAAQRNNYVVLRYLLENHLVSEAVVREKIYTFRIRDM